MKITVSQRELLSKLKTVGRIVLPSKTLPACENYLFEIGESFHITGSDVSGVMTGKVETLSIENSGTDSIRLLVDKTIFNALVELSDQPIEISINEKNLRIEVTYQNGHFEIQGGNAEAFPQLIASEVIANVVVEKQRLLEGLKSVMPFVANDELRPIMSGVYFESKEGSLVFCATDANALSVREYADCEYPDFNSVIPTKACKIITGIVGESKSETVEVSISGKNITVVTDMYTLVYRLIEGRYPNFRNVIPKSHSSSITVNTEELQSAIRRISVFSNMNSHLIKLNLLSGVIKIDAEDIDFSISATENMFTISHEGEPMTIGFNATRLIEVLSAVNTSECTLDFIDAGKAAIIHPNGVEGITLLIMPMLIKE